MVSSVNNNNNVNSAAESSNNNANNSSKVGSLAGLSVSQSNSPNESPVKNQAVAKTAAAATAPGSNLKNGDVTKVNPTNGNNGGTPVLFVNGIGTSNTGADSTAQTLANQLHQPVNLVYQQSTIGDVAIKSAGQLLASAALGGLAGGIGAVANLKNTVKADLDNQTAETSLENQIKQQLQSNPNGPVKIIGYSQGAHITAAALQQLAKNDPSLDLSKVQVLTLGGAASASDFPKGVQLNSLYHKNDPVSQIFGANSTSLASDIGPALSSGKSFLGIPIPDLNPKDIENKLFASHLTYFSDPNSLNAISQWQKNPSSLPGNIQLAD